MRDGATPGAGVPPPKILLPLAGVVPGVVLRVVPGLLAVACGVVLDAGPTILVLLALGGAALVAWPGRPVAGALLVLVGLVVFAGPDLLGTGVLSTGADGAGGSGAGSGGGGGAAAATGGWLRTGLLVLCTHLMVRSAALASHVAWRGLVEVPVLVRAAGSVLGIQVVVQGLVLAVVWFRAGVGGVVAGQGWLRVVAALAVVAITAVTVPRVWLRRDVRDGEDADGGS